MQVRARGESGSSLLIALAVMVAMGVVVAALASYAMTNHKATTTFRTVREKRYAGQAAIAELVNQVKDKPQLGTDPSLPITHPPCVTQVPVTIKKQSTIVTASCAAESGGGSGTPNDTGLIPPEGMVLLGARQNEPGPYNAPPCTGWWDSIQNFFVNLFTYNNILQQNDSLDIIRESSFRLKNRTAAGTLGATCTNRDRGTRSTFQIKGDLTAAGRMDSNGYPIAVIQGTLQARAGCNFAGCNAVGTRSGFSGAQAYLNGSAKDTDPGRWSPSSPQQNPMNNIAPPWLSHAFNNDGSVRALGYTATALMPSRLPTRTSAYTRDPVTGAITALGSNTCPSSATTIVFLPGWYKDASLLNAFTTGATCTDATLWFSPDPGPDQKLLTEDDRTGAFYFDFDTGSGPAQACNGLTATKLRWCVGGSTTNSNGNAAQSPRIVAGTPDGWTPRSTGGNGALDPNTTYRVSVDNAQTVDDDLSQRWTNSAGARQIGDGQVASYSANVCIPWINWCFSQDRAIRVRDFTPDVTGAPVDLPGASRGRVYLQVRYGVRNATSVDPARAIIEAVAPDVPRKSCGTYTLYSDRTLAEAGNGPTPTLVDYVFTDAQAKQLADACGNVDLLNGLEVKIDVRGNTLNQPKADWFLDGVKFYYDSFDNASFPTPTGSGNPAAKTDCDPSEPGAQFIFGGASHVYVADGSLEICAGPYADATNLDEQQSIGVWAMPAVGEVVPTGVSNGGSVSSFNNTGAIGDIDQNNVRMNYNACGLFECTTRTARMNIGMAGYTAPAGYVIKKVTARFGYNARTQCLPLFDFACGRPSFKIGSCGETGANKINGTLQMANLGQLTAFENGGPNCIGVGGDRKTIAPSTFQYTARCTFWCVGGNYDEVDGVRYQITLEPENQSVPRAIPQTGCIVAHPNYSYGGFAPDCALIRSDLARANDGWSLPWAQKESGDSRGRISVKGTIYAPSSAIEVDDTDLAYPLATRGAVLRHLRISGFRFRSGYNAPAIDNTVDRSTAPREMIMTACIQSSARRTARAACDPAQDQVITRARVRYELDPSTSVAPENKARIPQIMAWTDVL